MSRFRFLFSAACALTQADSLLHPGQEVFGVAAPHLGVLQRRLHSIITATKGQVCFLGWEGVHHHHFWLRTLGAGPRAHTVSIGLHPTVWHSWRTQTACKKHPSTPEWNYPGFKTFSDNKRIFSKKQNGTLKKRYPQTQNRKHWLRVADHIAAPSEYRCCGFQKVSVY